MLTDIEIAHGAKLKKIGEIAASLGISEEEIEPYGHYKAKISEELFRRLSASSADGKLILVTAINPTPAGEGKTTTSVGLSQAMKKIGKKSVLALREPSLGPVFGIKGGAAGGGYSQVVPMEDINLHFTGDMHAITSANNLLCALVDNHITQGNVLDVDSRRILVKRCMDMNDRALRDVIVGLGGKINGVPREEGFLITVATEIMAILCLSADLVDLKDRLKRILVAYDRSGNPIFAKDIGGVGAMAALLRDAIKPNLVQTLENTPVLIHGGPFANIAHGCNSLRATKLALKLGDYAITEAGFGSDLGAEKFFDIKCRIGDLKPNCVVLVATVRALKYNGGIAKENLKEENLEALAKGIVNLDAHVENMKKYGVPVVVAINRFESDSQQELDMVAKRCEQLGASFALSEVFTKGGDGGVELAKCVVEACDKQSAFAPLYSTEYSIKDKVEEIVTRIYGGQSVNYTPQALQAIADIEKLGFSKLPVCIAKTQYSLSDDPKKLGRPRYFDVSVRDVRLSAGAGFIVILLGEIMTMPGLPKLPAANTIDVDYLGNITGLS